MAALLIALVVVLILFGVGFTLHILWWIAVAALIVWLLGFLVHGGRGGRHRWYYW